MPTKRIEKLSREQLEQLPLVRDEWLAHGLSTEPASRDEALAGVHDAYRAAGLEPPPLAIWLDSPLAGALGRLLVGWLLRDRDQVGDQVGGQVGGQVGDQVGDQVGGQVWDQVCFGQHEAGWLSFVDTFRRFGLRCCDRASGLIKVGQCAGWWWPLRGAVILTERPRELHRDEDGRLHSEDGAAVLYPDGWGVYAIHGVRVPQQVIEAPATLSVEQIQNEANVEARRVMIDRFTPERYLRESDAALLDEVHEPPFPGLLHAQLWSAQRPNDEPMVMVKCLNSTPEPDGEHKVYWLRVPPSCKSAHEALAWTWDMDVGEYVPTVES